MITHPELYPAIPWSNGTRFTSTGQRIPKCKTHSEDFFRPSDLLRLLEYYGVHSHFIRENPGTQSRRTLIPIFLITSTGLISSFHLVSKLPTGMPTACLLLTQSSRDQANPICVERVVSHSSQRVRESLDGYSPVIPPYRWLAGT